MRREATRSYRRSRGSHGAEAWYYMGSVSGGQFFDSRRRPFIPSRGGQPHVRNRRMRFDSTVFPWDPRRKCEKRNGAWPFNLAPFAGPGGHSDGCGWLYLHQGESWTNPVVCQNSPEDAECWQKVAGLDRNDGWRVETPRASYWARILWKLSEFVDGRYDRWCLVLASS